jgi:hypothetical protein
MNYVIFSYCIPFVYIRLFVCKIHNELVFTQNQQTTLRSSAVKLTSRDKYFIHSPLYYVKLHIIFYIHCLQNWMFLYTSSITYLYSYNILFITSVFVICKLKMPWKSYYNITIDRNIMHNVLTCFFNVKPHDTNGLDGPQTTMKPM